MTQFNSPCIQKLFLNYPLFLKFENVEIDLRKKDNDKKFIMIEKTFVVRSANYYFAQQLFFLIVLRK